MTKMNSPFTAKPYHHRSRLKRFLLAAAFLAGFTPGVHAQVDYTIGVYDGINFNDGDTYPTPFGNRNAGQRAQYLYRATDLTSLGAKAGWVSRVSYKVAALNGSGPHADFTLYVGGTALTSMPASTTPYPYINVPLRYGPRTQTPVVGMNNFDLDDPYYWNGSESIVVGTCFWNAIDNKNASVEWTTGLSYDCAVTYLANAASTMGTAVCNTTSVPTLYKTRPDPTFRIYSDSCKGKPDAGAAASSVTKFCTLDAPFKVSLKGMGLATGLSFQWQDSNATTGGVWVDMGAPTTTTIGTTVTTQPSATWYRCVVTCTYSGLADTSDKVYVAQAPAYECDCVSTSTDNTQEKVLSVSFNTMFNATPCGVGAGFYSDYTTAVAPTTLEPGTSYTLTVRVGSCSPANNNRAIKVFIDYNQNSVYEVSELVYANTYSALQPNPQNATGIVTVPTTAKRGRTGMRIVYGQATSLSGISACGTYTYGETQDYSVNILPFGAPTVSGRLEVCQYDSVVMDAFTTADTPYVFNWTGPGGFTGTGPKITFTDADPSLSGTYYVTVTSGAITSSPRAVEVIVHPKPAVPNVLNAKMCQYESENELKTDGKNVIWYNVPVGGFGYTTPPKMNTTTPNTATYYLTQTVNGCVSDRGMVEVQVVIKPPPPIVVSPVSYCQLQDPTLVATGENLKWYLDPIGGVPSVISPIPPTSFPDIISYYVSQTVNGCESDRAKIQVNVFEQPNGIVLQSKKFVCQYDTASFTYFGNAPATYEYKWWSEGGTYLSGGGQGPVRYRFNTPGDQYINLYVNNGDCATFKIVDTITVRPAPTAYITPIDTVCIDVPVTITMDSTTPNLTAYEWDWNGGRMVYETINGGPYGYVWSTPGNKTLTLVVTARECKSLKIQETFNVQDRPNTKIAKVFKIDGQGDSTTLGNKTICSRDTVYFATYFDSTYKYRWSPSYYFDNGTDTSYQVVDRIQFSNYIRVDVTSRFGCKNADSVFVNVEPCCTVLIPNAFTPNGDRLNDRFNPVTTGHQEIVMFRVVNRWGNQVYESANTDDDGWDGTWKGVPQDMGTYNYYLKYKCLDGNTYEMKGDVILIR